MATLLGRRERVARGKVVGGSSQVNGCGALRPPEADLDAWAGLDLIIAYGR